MKQFSFAILVGATILFSAFTVNNSINWKITDDYSIKFKGTDAEGIFKKMSGDISFNEKDLTTSKFAVSIDVASINTGNGMKNKHAVSNKWFDAEKYPSITFTSSKISKSAKGYKVDGTLEMHGTKKQVSIPFTFTSNTFKGKFSVNRMDFGIGTMKGMSKKVSNKIELEISVPVSKK
ncbi:MAG: YceI family protein [Saprospiraceae bacterium]